MTDLDLLMQRQESLDNELQGYLVDSILGPVIKHPLVFSIPHSPQLNAMANARLRAKQAECRIAAERRDWTQYLFLHERPFRVHAFTRISAQLGDVDYWTRLADLWVDAENIYEHEHLWVTLLQDESRTPRRHLMMTEAERRNLARNPETVSIHRGFTVDGRHAGMSWTLNFSIARNFALRFGGHGPPRVASGTVRTAAVIAYLRGRGEHEIVVMPDDVTNVSVAEV
ncbi:hypothetical protein [Mycolicibacterium palauense]|uniref:hypothetical protein n=1 Tax=Mycolicibacterium palauense TaxID=2034511 RepID=UPI000BFEFBC6|nr:hypothetical protein [Mycolicibacterium palauense]